ncbi:hypothetical protein ABZ543_07990 [Streptomyces roseifaciens]
MYEETFYAVYDDGSTGMLTVTAQEEASFAPPVLTKPGRLVAEKAYNRAQASLVAATAAYVEELVAADRERTRGDYEALTALGLPGDTARRMSGWQGED